MKYETVPFILTGKDLDYLQDAFNWNYIAYKCAINAEENICDDKLRKHLKNISDQLNQNMNSILDTLKEGENESSK